MIRDSIWGLAVDEKGKFLRYSTIGLQVLTYVFAGEQTFQLLSSPFFESLSSPSLFCQCKALFASTLQMLPLKIQNVLGSIPSSSDTVESEVRHMKQSKISFIKNIKTIPLYYSTRIYYNRECPKITIQLQDLLPERLPPHLALSYGANILQNRFYFSTNLTVWHWRYLRKIEASLCQI